MKPRARIVASALIAPGAVLFTACLLDLGSLSSGGASAGGGTTSSSTSSVSSSGGDAGDDGDASDAADAADAADASDASDAGDASCPLLDCTCVGGPTVLAAGATLADTPRGIAVTSDGVYWLNRQSNELRRLPAGGGPPELLASTPTPRAIAIAGGKVVWTADDGVHTCQASSCSGSQSLVFASLAPGSLRDVAFDGQIAVWTDQGTGSNNGKTRACAIDACAAPNDLDTNLTAPGGVTLYGNSAFWVDQGTGNLNGNVTRELKVGGSYAQLAAALDLPTTVAVDDAYIYWTSWLPSGHVYRCPYTAGYCNTPEDFAPAGGALGRPFDLSVVGGRIYWTSTDDGSIMSCPQPGCGTAKPKVHVSGRQGLHRLAVGSSCIFWTEDGGGGAVMKIAR